MKTKTILVAFIALLISFRSFSQSHESNHKIKALKVAFITEKLNLTEQEAIKFWPVYNKFEEKIHDLYSISRRDIRTEIEKLGGIEKLTESQAKVITDKMLALDKAEYEIQVDYYKEMRNVISNKRIIILQNTERDFNKKLFTRYKRLNTSNKDDKRN